METKTQELERLEDNELFKVDEETGDIIFVSTNGRLILAPEVQEEVSMHVRKKEAKKMLRECDSIAGLLTSLTADDCEIFLDALAFYAVYHIDQIAEKIGEELGQLALKTYQDYEDEEMFEMECDAEQNPFF